MGEPQRWHCLCRLRRKWRAWPSWRWCLEEGDERCLLVLAWTRGGAAGHTPGRDQRPRLLEGELKLLPSCRKPAVIGRDLTRPRAGRKQSVRVTSRAAIRGIFRRGERLTRQKKGSNPCCLLLVPAGARRPSLLDQPGAAGLFMHVFTPPEPLPLSQAPNSLRGRVCGRKC